ALAADYTLDCVIHSPSGGMHQGREAAERVLRHVFDALDVNLREQSLLIDGDRVAEEVSIEGKGIGQFLGLPATGRSFRVPGVFLYELKEGSIVRERRIYDFTALLVQTGLLKTKPAE
ncbi:MAG: ester cyclase, partial [Acidobacteriota bacterium]